MFRNTVYSKKFNILVIYNYRIIYTLFVVLLGKICYYVINEDKVREAAQYKYAASGIKIIYLAIIMINRHILY